MNSVINIKSGDIRVGDAFRIYNRYLATSGTITKINRVNFKYSSVYGLTGEVMNLQGRKSDLFGEGVQIRRRIP